MGDERRDFDTPGRTNGQHDQTEPAPPRDDTQPFAAPDETQPAAEPDETQAVAAPDETQPAAGPDETQAMAAPDETQPFTPLGQRDETTVMPPERSSWSGRAGVAPPAGPNLRDSAPYTQQIPQPEQPRPWWTPLLLGGLALGLLGVLILVAWWMGRDDSPPPVEPPAASVVVPTEPTEPTTEPPTQAPSVPAQIVQIPRLVGLPIDQAVAQLDQLGLAYRFEYRQSDDPEGTVIQASPPEGTVVPVQATVILVVSTGSDRTPSPALSPSPSRAAASAGPN